MRIGGAPAKGLGMAATAAFLLAGSLASGLALEDPTVTDASTVRGAFLARGTAARPVGMGEAFTAVADDASGAAWNPGGLGQVRGISAVVQYETVGIDMSFSTVAGAFPLGPGVAGLGVIVAALGSYEERDGSGAMTGTADLTDMAFSASYAVRNPFFLGGKGWTGLTVEVVNEAVAGSMFAVSVGGLYPLSAEWRAGWALQHVGPAVDGFTLPMSARAGAAYALGRRLLLSMDAGYGVSDGQLFLSAGAEVTPHPLVSARVGYKYLGDQGIDGLTGLTGGLGVRYNSFGLDYAFQPFGSLATSHRIALVYGMGPTR